MDIRILWRYENGVIILLLDVGHRKDIWKYETESLIEIKK
jgi:hypothetical protein